MSERFRDARSQRADPGMAGVVHREHLDRYQFAAPYCRGRRVVEVGCGTGYGAAELAAVAAEVDAVDLYEPGLAEAARRFPRPNLRFRRMDGTRLAFPDASVGAVVAFEVIEHVDDPPAFLAEVWRVLEPGGVAVLSTPNAVHTSTDGKPGDPSHQREYTPDELRAVLAAARFARVELLGQTLPMAVWRSYQVTAQAARMDRLGLRRLLPPAVKRRLLAALLRVRGGVRPGVPASTIGPDLAGAVVQVAVCHK